MGDRRRPRADFATLALPVAGPTSRTGATGLPRRPPSPTDPAATGTMGLPRKPPPSPTDPATGETSGLSFCPSIGGRCWSDIPGTGGSRLDCGYSCSRCHSFLMSARSSDVGALIRCSELRTVSVDGPLYGPFGVALLSRLPMKLFLMLPPGPAAAYRPRLVGASRLGTLDSSEAA